MYAINRCGFICCIPSRVPNKKNMYGTIWIGQCLQSIVVVLSVAVQSECQITKNMYDTTWIGQCLQSIAVILSVAVQVECQKTCMTPVEPGNVCNQSLWFYCSPSRVPNENMYDTTWFGQCLQSIVVVLLQSNPSAKWKKHVWHHLNRAMFATNRCDFICCSPSRVPNTKKHVWRHLNRAMFAINRCEFPCCSPSRVPNQKTCMTPLESGNICNQSLWFYLLQSKPSAE